jgi:hypothetical protein
VTLGKQYFLLSRHTSLLVLENDAMYAQYGVRKGSGDRWAPYAMPQKITAVAPQPGKTVPADVADDAEVVRAPLQVFYNHGAYDDWSSDEDRGGFGLGWNGSVAGATISSIGHGSGTGQGFGITRGGRGRSGGGAIDKTRASLGLVIDRESRNSPLASDPAFAVTEARAHIVEKKAFTTVDLPKAKPAGPRPSRRARISAGEVAGGLLGDFDLRRASMHRHAARAVGYYGSYYNNLTPARLTHPSDTAFDDLTAFVPALLPDAADV